MEIFYTFDEQFQGVYLARFVNCAFYQTPNKYETELDKIQDQLQDSYYVRNFIKSKQSGWQNGSYKNDSLKYLTTQVLKEAADLFDKLDELNERSQTGNCFELLFDAFTELSKSERLDDPGRRKMYTYDYGSLLRLYGIRLGNDTIILSGAGIKLVDKMTYLKDWLKQEKIKDSTDL